MKATFTELLGRGEIGYATESSSRQSVNTRIKNSHRIVMQGANPCLPIIAL